MDSSVKQQLIKELVYLFFEIRQFFSSKSSVVDFHSGFWVLGCSGGLSSFLVGSRGEIRKWKSSQRGCVVVVCSSNFLLTFVVCGVTQLVFQDKDMI
jgi:hypothetical protein